MEFYHLRSFVAVAQTGNLTQAAKRLYTTPPAISAHIKNLEDELSTCLFTRSSKGMCLTEKGQLLLIKAQQTLDSAVDLVNLAADNQHEIIGTFDLGINLPAEQVKLAELAQNIQHNCAGISLNIQSLSSGQIINAIREQQLMGGYIFGDVPDDFIGITVIEKNITTIAPLNVDVNQFHTLEDLSTYQWIMMSDYCPFDCLLKQKLGSNISSIINASDELTRLALVKQGGGFSFLEQQEAMLAAKKQQVNIIPLLDFSTQLHFVIAKSRANEPLIKTLTQQIKVLWDIAN